MNKDFELIARSIAVSSESSLANRSMCLEMSQVD
jgi:hypothetical protein